MLILGIETSCDETAISMIETEGKIGQDFRIKILSNEVLSQIALHRKYGGVFPMLAKREHNRNLIPLLKIVLEKAAFENSKLQTSKSIIKKTDGRKLKAVMEREPELWEQFEKEIPKIPKPPIDAIAITKGPGLEPALWTGINFAKSLSTVWNIPLIPINHMEGHIFAGLLKKNDSLIINHKPPTTDVISYKLSVISFPAIALLVSGGHTELILVKNWFEYRLIGATRDDAVGEAFDKVARILGLPYPGGPEISRLAEIYRHEISANNQQPTNPNFKFPRPMLKSNDFDFSFSGIKTSVLYAVKKIPILVEETKKEIAKEFEDAVVETLVTKTKKALEQFDAKTLVIGGGVAANKFLRDSLVKMTSKENVKLFIPEISHSTDNALMIAVAGAVRYKNFGKKSFGTSFKAQGGFRIDNSEDNI